MIITDPRYTGLLPERTPYYISSLAERFFLLNFQKQNPLVQIDQYTDYREFDTADCYFSSAQTKYIIETKLRQYSYSYLKRFDDGNHQSGILIEIRKYDDLIEEGRIKNLPVLYINCFTDDVILIFNLNEVQPLQVNWQRNDGRSFYSTNKTNKPAYLIPFAQACIEHSQTTNYDNIFSARNRLFIKTGDPKYLTTSINKLR